MAEYIERQKVIDITAETGALETQRRVQEIPAADVVKVVHAKWVNINGTQAHYCNQCGMDFDLFAYCKDKFLYCPYCGAKMDLEESK